LFVGINGSQGSGKSTLTEFLTAYLSQVKDCPCIGMSIDDFYLTKSQRLALSEKVHPLLATRGVPGTHDLDLLTETLHALFNDQPPYSIPVFVKAIDDRASTDDWQRIRRSANVVILEGWCVGCPSQPEKDLIKPVNNLEAREDSTGTWRNYANLALKKYNHRLFAQLDRLIMLQAPGFHVVKRWRLEQEQKLAASLNEADSKTDLMSAEQIERFIQHYQRITEFGLNEIPKIADDIFQLDDQRNISAAKKGGRS
jgi:D-glycerate 3-kinase